MRAREGDIIASPERATGELSRRACRGGPAALFRTGRALLLAFLAVSLPVAATTMQQAIDAATAELLEGLFDRPPGVVRWIQGPDEVVLTFDGPVAERGSEFVVQRRAGGSPFPRTVALLRVLEVRDSMARSVVLWRDGALETGDAAVAPQPVTVFLDVPEDPSAPGQSRQLREAADRLELALLDDPRVRVVRVEQGALPAGETALARFAETREYATVLTPQFISGDQRAELVFTQRSIFSGETLLLARAELPAGVGLAASGLPGRGESAVAAPPAAPPPSGYAPGIRTLGRGTIHSAGPLGAREIALPDQIEAIAVGDVDGDGRLEIAGTTKRQLLVYRWDGQRLQTVAQGEPLPRLTSYVHVDAGDVNQNGRAEIVVSYVSTFHGGGAPQSNVESRIYEVRGGSLTEVVPAIRGRYARVLEAPDGAPVLLTQRLGDMEPFAGQVDVHRWAGGRYERVGRSPLPAGVHSLYGLAWSDLDGDRRPEFALIDDQDRLNIKDADGQPLWRDDLGPVATALGFPQLPHAHKQELGAWSEQTPDAIKAEWRTMPRRLVAARLRDGGSPGAELITLTNGPATGFRYAAGGTYEGGRGQALGFGWDPSSGRVAKLWETAPLEAPARDLAVGDLLGDGRAELVVLQGKGDTRALTVVPLLSGAS